MRRFAIALLAAAVACGGSDTISPLPLTETGTYQLSTVNGAPLPFLLSSQSGNSHYISGGDLALDAETHAWTMVVRESYTGPIAQPPGQTTLFGNYTISGTSITLTLAYAQGGGTIPATLNGDALTVTDGGRAMLFTRRE